MKQWLLPILFLFTLMSQQIIASPVDPNSDAALTSNRHIEKSKFSDSFCAKAADEEAYRATGTEAVTDEDRRDKILNHVYFIKCLEDSLGDGEKITSDDKQKEFCEKEGPIDIDNTVAKLKSLKPSSSGRYTKKYFAGFLDKMKVVKNNRSKACAKFFKKMVKNPDDLKNAADNVNDQLQTKELADVNDVSRAKIKEQDSPKENSAHPTSDTIAK